MTVELSFDGHFELTQDDADIVIQLTGGAVLWQKERLLNLALQAVPSDVKNVAWIDCDIVFKRTDWVDEANRQLNELSVTQLFSDAVHLSSDDHITQTDCISDYDSVPGIAGLPDARNLILSGSNFNYYQSGFAWAANRTLLESHGFYDAAIVGSGDCLMVAAMLGQFGGMTKRFLLNEMRREHYLRWAIPFHNSVAARVGYIPGTICHLWHGAVENRKYSDRHSALANFNLDPENDLRIGANGAWQWARPRPDLESFLASYFVNRAEDE